MMTLRDWVAKTAIKDEPAATATVFGQHGVHITRAGQLDSYVYCSDIDTAPFDLDDFETARSEIAELEFICVLKRPIANEVYEFADSKGVPVGGVGDLQAALRECNSISEYVSREDRYVRSRLSNPNILDYRRRGATTYEIYRRGGLSTLIVAMVERYELTAEDAYEIIRHHPGIRIDAVVTTNPNTRGLSGATIRAIANAGTKGYTINDFLASLDREWNH
jgi:hypothetical protein